jgi:hypothetical protein
MLIAKQILERIQAGEVTMAFRRWRRPTVKAGGTLKTSVGILRIDDIESITLAEISDADVKRAGYSSRDQLVSELSGREGQLFRIALSYAGDDPRIELRENAKLSVTEMDSIVQQLQRLDSRSRVGPWTRQTMRAIHDHPMTPAAGLAAKTGLDKDWLKINVRKLKNLGLTISHQPGYTLSPRGIAVLKHLG